MNRYYKLALLLLLPVLCGFTLEGVPTGESRTQTSINLTANSNQVVLDSDGNPGTITASPTGTRVYTMPDASGTVAVSATTPVTLSATGDIGLSSPLPVANGGTGATSWTDGQLLIGNTTGNTAGLGTLTGTANQVTVTNGSGSVTLSGPQDLATTSEPTFVGVDYADGTDTSIIKHIQETGLGGRLTVGLDETARTMVICDAGDMSTDFALGVFGDPVLRVISADGLHDAYMDYNTLKLYSGNGPWAIEADTGYFYGKFVKFASQYDFGFGNGWSIVDNGVQFTDTDNEQSIFYIQHNINQSATAAYNGLQIEVTETGLGDGSTGTGGTNNLIAAGTAADPDMFRVKNDGSMQIENTAALSTAQQDIVVDATTNGTTTISKAGENFSSTVAVGDIVEIYGGTTAADYGLYLVQTVTSDTALVLSRAPSGSNADVDFRVFRDGMVVADDRVAMPGNVMTDYILGDDSNTFLGVGAVPAGLTHATGTQGWRNTAVGYNAGTALTSGFCNTLVGRYAGTSLTSGANNVAVGQYVLNSANTTSGNVAIGSDTARGFPTNVVAIGPGSLGGMSGDHANTVAVGYGSGQKLNNKSDALTDIENSVFLGYRTSANAAGETNETVIGYEASGMGSNTVVLGNDSVTETYLKGGVTLAGEVTTDYILGSDTNTFLGVGAVPAGLTHSAGTEGWYNTAVGNDAGKNITSGDANTLLGYSCGSMNSGTLNTCIGRGACSGTMQVPVGGAAVGYLAGSALGNTQYFVALGYSALRGNNTATGTIAIGYQSAMYENNGTDDLDYSTYGVYIGHDVRGNADSETNSIVIGKQALGRGSNTTTIGNTDTTSWMLYGGMIVETESVTCGDGTNTCAYNAAVVSSYYATDDDTDGADVVTVTDGSTGQRRTFALKTDNGDDLSIVPSNLANGTSLTLDTAGESVTLEFDGANWYIVGGYGYAVVP